jgi:hypothetical protein
MRLKRGFDLILEWNGNLALDCSKLLIVTTAFRSTGYAMEFTI